MSFRGLAVENVHIVPAIPPLNITGAGADGDWVSMKHWRKLAIVIEQGAWAGGTSAVTLQQASDNAGTGAKALSFEKKYEGTALTDDVLFEVAVTSGTFNLDTANKYHLIEVLASDLDTINDFTHVRVRLGTPGVNADVVGAIYILYDGDYAGDPVNQPSAI